MIKLQANIATRHDFLVYFFRQMSSRMSRHLRQWQGGTRQYLALHQARMCEILDFRGPPSGGYELALIDSSFARVLVPRVPRPVYKLTGTLYSTIVGESSLLRRAQRFAMHASSRSARYPGGPRSAPTRSLVTAR